MPIDWVHAASSYAATIVTSTLLSAAIVWGFKEVISNRLKGSIGLVYDSKLAAIQTQNAKELQEAKSELEAANAKTLTQQSHELQLKAAEQSHELQLKAKEFELKYSGMYEKRAEILAEIYAALVWTFRRLQFLTSSLDFGPDNNTKENVDQVHEANHKFDQAFSPTRIYLPRTLAHKLQIIHSRIRDETHLYWAIWFQEKIKFDAEQGDRSIDLEDETMRNWQEKIVDVNTTINTILVDLEAEMRKLLGADQ